MPSLQSARPRKTRPCRSESEDAPQHCCVVAVSSGSQFPRAQDAAYGAELEFSDLHTQASFLSQRSEAPSHQLGPSGGLYGGPGG